MKILLDNEGQTCNVFWCYLRPLQLAIQNDLRFVVPFYDKEIDDYDNLRSCRYLYFPLYSRFAHKLLGPKTYTKLIKQIVHNKFYNILPFLKNCSSIFIDGWSERNDVSDQYLLEIKRFFLPNDCIKQKVNQLFTKQRNNYDLIVGVHIRRGDYRTWHNGAYYYSINEYAKICRKLESFLNKKISFFISSNEKLDIKEFNGLSIFRMNDGVSCDLFGLSCCDYIIGPPSSFSRWASFMGEVPIHFILKPNEDQFNFRTVYTYSKYSNGELITFDF